MKNNFLILFCFILMLSGENLFSQSLPVSSCSASTENTNQNISKAIVLQAALNELVRNGVPGCSMAVLSEEGWWTGSAGYAKIEDKTLMQSCHLQYLQSVSKTYMAVAILILHEQGKINLDESITKYLPETYCRYITNAGKISVRMLLNHTSGIPEYNSVPNYITRLLQHPDHYFTAEDYLKYVASKPLDFVPGSKYSYRNTNYVILSLIADAITGDHAKFIDDSIFKPLGLTHTFYRNDEGYLKYPELVNTYWDRHSDGILENASVLQRNNVLALVGDDGIVATPEEAVIFLKGLMEGKLISSSSLKLMQTWVNDSKGKPTYGLGLDHSMLREHVAYGHSGGGIGAGCQLYYVPDKHIYYFIGINLGTVTDSPLHQAVEKTLDKLYNALLD